MLIVVWYLVPGLFLFGVVVGQGFIEKLVVDLFQIVVAVGHILLRAAPVYIRRKKLPVIVADTAWAHHAGYSRTDKITHPFYRPNLLPIPSYHSPRRGTTPLCYFLWGESNAKALSHRRPVGGVSMKVLLRATAEHTRINSVIFGIAILTKLYYNITVKFSFSTYERG